MIRLHEIRKRYGALVAVDGVSFEIKPGEAFGLLGPNGAGKTTTIHLLVGVLRPDSGTVEIDGATDPTRAEVRRRIGVSPQSLSLYEELSAAENLTFFASLYGMAGTALRQRVEWCLEFAGLSDRRNDRVKTYSGGMKRRLNLAAAVVHEPAVLLLDEPTVGVDPQSRNHIFERIESLKQRGCTIVYTTHYMEEAQRLCDRVAIMDHGKILALDSVDGLIRQHGGRSIIEAELDRPPADAARLGGTLEGTHLRIETERPFEEIARLSTGGTGFATLSVRRPDLENVFLSLTGRTLRDA